MARVYWHQAPNGSEWWIFENMGRNGEYNGSFTVMCTPLGVCPPVGPFYTVQSVKEWCDFMDGAMAGAVREESA